MLSYTQLSDSFPKTVFKLNLSLPRNPRILNLRTLMPNLPFKNCFLRSYSHRAAFPEQFHVQFSLSMPPVRAAQLPGQAVLIFRPLFIALPDLWDPLYSCGMPSIQLQVSSPGLCTKSLTPFTQLFYKNNYCVCGLYSA